MSGAGPAVTGVQLCLVMWGGWQSCHGRELWCVWAGSDIWELLISINIIHLLNGVSLPLATQVCCIDFAGNFEAISSECFRLKA